MELCAAGGGASVPTSRLPHLLSDLHHQQRQHLLSKDVLHYIDNVSAVRKYIVCPTATISKTAILQYYQNNNKYFALLYNEKRNLFSKQSKILRSKNIKYFDKDSLYCPTSHEQNTFNTFNRKIMFKFKNQIYCII